MSATEEEVAARLPPITLYAVEYSHPKRNGGKTRMKICESQAEAEEALDDLVGLKWTVNVWRL